jgi:hypothetical protein
VKPKQKRWIVPFLISPLLLWASDSFSGMNIQGMNIQGMNIQGMNIQGMNIQGMNIQGMNIQGMNIQGMNIQGMNIQGMNIQGMNIQGMNIQGMNIQGMNIQGMPMFGIDRVRGMAGSLEYAGLAFSDGQTSSILQGVQTNAAINYVQVAPPLPRLQAGPAAAGPGSFIYVDSLNGSHTARDLTNSFWNLIVSDSTGQGAIPLYISEVAKDTTTNLSNAPLNDDVYLYTVYYRHPATQQWLSLCPVDEKTGKASAMAIPLNPSDWSSTPSRQKFTFACTASGVGSKCARIWGYKPWGSAVVNQMTVPLQPFYDSCVIAARADYCQDGQSYTKDGTTVDLFDSLGINPTAGVPYAPNSSGTMVHEEYQISAYNQSTAGPAYASIAASDLASYSPSDQALLSKLRMSGMESSRYGDLDPGRTCLAAPWIDRCDPHEPYACYRAANMGSSNYGAFISVNSPRHCSHDVLTDGEPLDPMCNLCVSRVCSVDATCCGDPGPDNYYPVSLVWDSHCADLSRQVCVSTPGGQPWSAGTVATPAGTTKVSYLHGAIGSFEGIVKGTTTVDGWACDPDLPTASVPVQISVGGPIGAAGTTLYTTIADAALSANWKAIVASECGGTGPHGFHYTLPSSAIGKDVYVYGVDLNVPGAPFTLLRGGKKNLPDPTKASPTTNANAALWTGWLEAKQTSVHAFKGKAAAGDNYRIWVDGIYVDGTTWPAPDPTLKNGITFTVPTPSSVSLRKGVRYPIRVEYLRASPTSTSSFTLQWQQTPTSTLATVPVSALFPMAPNSGTGLLATYFSGSFGTANATTTTGAVDYLWTKSCVPDPKKPKTCDKLPSPLTPDGAFSARFTGQIVPPVSGDYTFTADTQGTAQIWVDGKLVTDSSRTPPGKGNNCTHDICRTGPAESRTCDQGYFCAGQVCLKDPACCSITWDAACLQEVATICHLECRQTAPIPVSLRAGVKYDIKIEFQHAGGGAAKMKLFWALGQGARGEVPASRLFTDGGTANGVGLNAAYFVDATTAGAFMTEALDHVAAASFSSAASSLPTAVLAASICSTTADPPGAPALSLATPAPLPAATPLELVVGGLVHAAQVTILEGTTTLFSSGTTRTDTDGGVVSTSLSFAAGTHTLIARELSGSKTVDSAPLTFTVVGTPPAAGPAVTVPAGGLTSDNGRVVMSGKATANATVTITGAGTMTKVTADGSGLWSTAASPYVLPSPGLYTLQISDSKGGTTTMNATYAIPALKIEVPTTADAAVASAFSVTASSPVTTGIVVVADGDGTYFTERGSAAVNTTTKKFTINLTGFDAGRHVLEVFQRITTNVAGVVNTLDGPPAFGSVVVAPQAGALTITSPKAGAGVDYEFAVNGTAPARQGLPYQIYVYQSGTKVGQGTVNEDATHSFSVPVHLTGTGNQQLFVALVASSLSGGGAVELPGRTGPVNVTINPPPPKFSTANPFSQGASTFTLAGTGTSGYSISATVDGAPYSFATTPSVGSNSNFSAPFTLSAGHHVIVAKQFLGNAKSADSVPFLVSIGDTTAPQIKATKTRLEYSTTSLTGLSVDYYKDAGVAASDNSGSVTVSCDPAVPTPSAPVAFPLGTTNAICSAADGAGNVASIVISVSIKSTATPTMSATNLVAEATLPSGAPVPYQVSMMGFLANCPTPGSSAVVECSSWQPIAPGLGLPTVIGVDAGDGTLYASQPGAPTATNAYPAGKLFKMANGATAWTPLDMPGPASRAARISVAPASGSVAKTLYVPADVGVLASTDGGGTWKNVLPGPGFVRTSVDPNNGAHLFAWTEPRPGSSSCSLFETKDGGQTWSYAADNMPMQDSPDLASPHVTDVAFDKLNPGRVYALVSPTAWADVKTPDLIYRRIANGRWERLSVPPASQPLRGFADSPLAVAPSLPPCTTGCQTFPTVFAGRLNSQDGGDTWIPNDGMPDGTLAYLFDRAVAGTIYASYYKSVDYGATWQPWTAPASIFIDGFAQDFAGTIYGTYSTGEGAGIYKTTDAGAHWAQATVPWSQSMIITDFVPDPVNSLNAYALTPEGVFKAYRGTDGKDAWKLTSSDQLVQEQLVIDPSNRQTIYLSGLSPFQRNGLISVDGAGDSGLPWAPKAYVGPVAPNPGAAGSLLMIAPGPGTVTGSGVTGLVYLFGEPTSQSYALDVAPMSPHAIEVLPDAAQTVVLSYNQNGGTTGGTVIFSARDSQLAPTKTAVRTILSGAPSRPVFDNSDGHNSIFVSGAALGNAPDHLWKASLDDLTFRSIGGGQPWIDFRRLAIDGGSDGQSLYTVGWDGLLWESHDGGATWTPDPSAPGLINRVWASPVDGTIYASIGNDTWNETDLAWQAIHPGGALYPGAIWRRADGAVPPDASIAKGKLRVTCRDTSGSGTRKITSGSVFPVGKTTLSCSAKDVFSNTLTSNVTIDVRDTTPPAITVVPPAPVTTTGTSATVTFTATAKDIVNGNLALVSSCPPTGACFTCDRLSGSSFNLGVTIVTCTARDASANPGPNTSTLKFPVVVNKSGGAAAPILTVPADMVVEATSKNGAVANPQVKATKSGGATIAFTCTPTFSATSTFALGTTAETCSATDAGFTVTRTFNVKVVDTKAPTLTVPATSPTANAQGSWGAPVAYSVTASDVVDGDLTASVACVPPSGTNFAPGASTVTCRVSDKAGNVTTKSFTVIVNDNAAPVLSLPALQVAEALDFLGARVTFTATATDAVEGPVNVVCAPPSGSFFSFGDTTVACHASDSAHNLATGAFTVRVIDTTPPTLTVPSLPVVVEAATALGGPASFAVSAFDAVSRAVTPVCTVPSGVTGRTVVTSGSSFAMGTNTVTCTATDAAGNAATGSFTVVVRDTTVPFISVPATIYAEAGADKTAIVTYPAVTATDLPAKPGDPVSSLAVACSPASGSRFRFGTTAVTCIARDSVGNQASKSFNVVVRDTGLPTLGAVPANITTFATLATGAVVTYAPPTATDAVDGTAPVTCTPASGSTFAPNKTTVSCVATDSSGNKSAAKTFTVWVQFSTTQTGGATFLAPLAADGSSVVQRSLGSLPVAFGMTGVSAPITTLSTASLTIAPVVNGVVGTFVAATPASGTGNLFTYDAVNKRYLYNMALANLADGTFRLHAELSDGLTREVSFSTVPPWTSLSLATGWTGGSYNTGTPASALLDGVVYLRGAMSNNGTGGITPFVLPAGRRPTSLIALPITLCSSIRGTLEIGTDGTVWVFGNNSSMNCFTSLEGVSFVVDNSAANGNQALTPQNGITNAGSPWRAPTARISSNVVHLAGALQTNGSGATAFNLPAAMRPAAYVYLPISYGGSSNYKGRLLVSPSGDVSVVPDSTAVGGEVTSLEGVTFPVPNTGTGWTCLTPTNGWTAMPYSTRNTCVKDVDGLIRLSGSVTTSGTNMSALALPAALRPAKDAYVEIDLCNGTMGRVHVTPAGIVTVESEASISNAQCFSSFEGAAFSAQ